MDKRSKQPILERIAANTIMLPNGCHGWIASRAGHGYPSISVNGKHRLVHRITHEQMFGPIPKGKEAHHKCENKGCINPLHIQPVTHAENIQIADPRKWSWLSKKTHCPKGHEYDEVNTYVWRGGRHCRSCRKARQQLTASVESEQAKD